MNIRTIKKTIMASFAVLTAACGYAASDNYANFFWGSIDGEDFNTSTTIYRPEGGDFQTGRMYKDLDLTYAVFDSVSMKGTSFAGKDLSHATFNIRYPSETIMYTDFTGANLTNASIGGAYSEDIRGMIFVGADLRGLQGFGANDFYYSDTKNTIFPDGVIRSDYFENSSAGKLVMNGPDDFIRVRKNPDGINAKIISVVTMSGSSRIIVEAGGVLEFNSPSESYADEVVLEFHVNQNESGVILVNGMTLTMTGSSNIEVVVPNDFTVSSEREIELIDCSNGSSRWYGDNMSVRHENGRAYKGGWSSVIANGIGIVFSTYYGDEDAEPATITGVSVDGEIVTVTAASENANGYYAIYSASTLTADESEWKASVESRGRLDSEGNVSATFVKIGNERFYRVAVSATNGGAETYSKNVGGFYTVNLPARTLQYVANQFIQPDQQISTVFSQLPNRSTVVVQDENGNSMSAVKNPVGAGWNSNGAGVIGIGKEAQVTSPSDASIVISGVLEEGDYSKRVSAKTEALVCSSLPVSGAPEHFGLELMRGITVRQMDAAGNLTSRSTAPVGAAWAGGNIPAIKIGEAFILSHPNDVSWRQSLRLYGDSIEIDVFN